MSDDRAVLRKKMQDDLASLNRSQSPSLNIAAMKFAGKQPPKFGKYLNGVPPSRRQLPSKLWDLNCHGTRRVLTRCTMRLNAAAGKPFHKIRPARCADETLPSQER